MARRKNERLLGGTLTKFQLNQKIKDFKKYAKQLNTKFIFRTEEYTTKSRAGNKVKRYRLYGKNKR